MFIILYIIRLPNSIIVENDHSWAIIKAIQKYSSLSRASEFIGSSCSRTEQKKCPCLSPSPAAWVYIICRELKTLKENDRGVECYSGERSSRKKRLCFRYVSVNWTWCTLRWLETLRDGNPFYFLIINYHISVSIRKSSKRGHWTPAEQECCIMID